MGKKEDTADRTKDFLESYVIEHGYPPSMREIAEALGLASPSTVQYNLRRLVAAGEIRVNQGRARGIEIIKWRRDNKDTIALLANRCSVLEKQVDSLSEELAKAQTPPNLLEICRLHRTQKKADDHGGIDHLVALDEAALRGKVLILTGMDVEGLKNSLMSIIRDPNTSIKSKQVCCGIWKGFSFDPEDIADPKEGENNG